MLRGANLNNQVRTITTEQATKVLSQIGSLKEFSGEFAAEVIKKTATSMGDRLAHIIDTSPHDKNVAKVNTSLDIKSSRK